MAIDTSTLGNIEGSSYLKIKSVESYLDILNSKYEAELDKTFPMTVKLYESGQKKSLIPIVSIYSITSPYLPPPRPHTRTDPHTWRLGFQFLPWTRRLKILQNITIIKVNLKYLSIHIFGNIKDIIMCTIIRCNNRKLKLGVPKYFVHNLLKFQRLRVKQDICKNLELS